MKNWLDTYRKVYYKNLNIKSACRKRDMAAGCFNRANGFELIFKLLLDIKQKDFNIIETGTTRRPDNWKDGNSGRIFTDFVVAHNGKVRSVDLAKKACKQAKDHITEVEYEVYCSDSVDWLKSLNDLSTVDLFYLDSYDVDWNNDTLSAEHHLQEFLAIEPFLTANTIVAIDDNTTMLSTGKRSGKGRLIVEYLDNKGITPIYDAYQIIYKF